MTGRSSSSSLLITWKDIKDFYLTCTDIFAVRRGVISKKCLRDGIRCFPFLALMPISEGRLEGAKVCNSDVIDFLLICILGSSAVDTLQVLGFPLSL